LFFCMICMALITEYTISILCNNSYMLSNRWLINLVTLFFFCNKNTIEASKKKIFNWWWWKCIVSRNMKKNSLWLAIRWSCGLIRKRFQLNFHSQLFKRERKNIYTRQLGDSFCFIFHFKTTLLISNSQHVNKVWKCISTELLHYTQFDNIYE
jgi:hypothetical protein